jgi:putative ABC transport system ATP-binding protein
MLEVKNLVKKFQSGDTSVTATDDISFTVPDGQFASIVGRSGSGKSTLLSLLGALDKPTSGSIVVGERDVTKLRDHELISYRGRSIGFVFQSYNLVPSLTTVLLQEVGLKADQMQRKPARLSGGQQQRVAIARALANKPQLILADEPTGNLDSDTGKKIFDLLHELSRKENTTILVVTHDLEIAGKTDKTFRLDDGKLVK